MYNAPKRKKPNKFLIYLVMFLALGYVLSLGSTADMKYSRAMKSGLNLETASGTKIVTYRVDDDEYSDKYLPRALRARNPAEVGAVLEVTAEQTHQRYGMNGSVWKTADILTFTLVDCDTQTEIGTRTYYPHFPSKSDGSVKYDTKGMAEWIETSWSEYLAQNG